MPAAHHPQDRVASLVAVSARVGAMFGVYAAALILLPLAFVVVALRGAPLTALPAAVGRPLLVVLATGAMFGAIWFMVYGTLWLLDRRTTLLELDGARPHFDARESIVREGLGAFKTSGASGLGKLFLTTTRLRFRSFRVGGPPLDESIDLGLIASVRVVRNRIYGVRAGHLLLTLHSGETRVFYGYDETSWRTMVGDAVNDIRGTL